MSDGMNLQDAQVLLQRMDQLEHDVRNLTLSVSMLTEIIKLDKGD